MPSFRNPNGNPLRFDEFMSQALYGERGFYTVGGEAGRRGDFITSPEIGPLFGAVLANWIQAEFVRLGEPDDFMIVEAGAGPGTLARSILLAAPQWTGRYVAVEVSAAQRAKHPGGVLSVADMPAAPFRGNSSATAWPSPIKTYRNTAPATQIIFRWNCFSTASSASPG